MTTGNAGNGTPGDPGHPSHNASWDSVDQEIWSRINQGQKVRGPSGEDYGQVRVKSERVFMADVPAGLFSRAEIYVPHIAVERVDADGVHVAWPRAQLDDTYEHYRQWHMPSTNG